MRSAVIGAFFAHDTMRRREFVAMSTRLTHTDARAEIAACAVADAAAWFVRGEKTSNEFLLELRALGQDEEWLSICDKLSDAYASKLSVSEFACSLGLNKGVTGYAFHTVPVALYAWLMHPKDVATALTSALDCGGDTDTVGAIVGALAGARIGETGIPAEWLERVVEWPRSIQFMETLAQELASASIAKLAFYPVRYFWPALIVRNAFFLAVVLAHGLRRLLPPYYD